MFIIIIILSFSTLSFNYITSNYSSSNFMKNKFRYVSNHKFQFNTISNQDDVYTTYVLLQEFQKNEHVFETYWLNLNSRYAARYLKKTLRLLKLNTKLSNLSDFVSNKLTTRKWYEQMIESHSRMPYHRWTKAEEQKLLDSVRIFGYDWKMI